MNFPVITISENKADLIKQIEDIYSFFNEFFLSIPLGYYSKNAIPEGWKIETNIKHLVTTTYLATYWLNAPNFFLKLFGVYKPKKIKIEKKMVTNRPGLDDYGKYILIEEVKFTQENLDNYLLKLKKSKDKLILSIQNRSDEEMYKFKFPLGGLNLIGLCLLLLKHNLHHCQVVNSRFAAI
jgi:hypothetical protein